MCKQFTTLDYIENIKVDGDVFTKPVNEYWALVLLKEGLNFLYSQAVKCDEIVLARSNPKVKVLAMGNSSLLTGVPKGLLTCAFHWYAVSVCQYVRIVGTIAYRQNQSRPKPRKYVKAVIPEVLAFRDKVAAHFVWTKDDSRDTDAVRAVSIVPMLTFSGDSFFIGGLKMFQKTEDKEEIGAFESWSITNVHHRLRERYWPEQPQSKADKSKEQN